MLEQRALKTIEKTMRLDQYKAETPSQFVVKEVASKNKNYISS
jgi:hypothetical protein